MQSMPGFAPMWGGPTKIQFVLPRATELQSITDRLSKQFFHVVSIPLRICPQVVFYVCSLCNRHIQSSVYSGSCVQKENVLISME